MKTVRPNAARMFVPSALDRELGRTVVEYRVMRGDAVFLDTFTGLVPALVTSVAADGAVTVRVTADRPGGYVRGETLTYEPAPAAVRVVPRAAVYVRSGQLYIRGWRFVPVADSAVRCAFCGGRADSAGVVTHMRGGCSREVI